MRGTREQPDWPALPDVTDPRPATARRAWGKLPHAERYRRQRSNLLQAAARLASRKGYQGTRIGDIVAEAGLSKGTFYEHFDSKEECFVELHRRTNAGMLRAGIKAAEASLDAGAAPHETVLAVIRALTGYVSRDPRLAEVLRVELGASQPAVGAERKGNQRRIVDLFVVIAYRLGTRLPADEIRLAASILVQGVTAVLPELRRDRERFDDHLRTLSRIACRGLGLAVP